jgi:hypothetical protein
VQDWPSGRANPSRKTPAVDEEFVVRNRPPRRPIAIALSLMIVAAIVPVVTLAGAQSSTVRLTTLSNRADLVSGGDVLTQIVIPGDARVSDLRVTLNGTDVTREFALRPNRKIEGLLTGLRLGANILVAQLQDGRGARLTITNHPIGGPIFSGPQIQPWLCEAGAIDKQCNKPATVTYSYEQAGTGQLESYDPKNPPPAATIATATTTEGVTVPFIVRT